MGASAVREGGERADDQIVLGLLTAVERDPTITQRGVASEIGIAVGLVNAYVKRCARKGLIKVRQAPARRYAYYLTALGMAEKSRLTASFLADSLSLFRRARAQYGAILQRLRESGCNRVILAGQGELAEITQLIAPSHGVEIVAVVDQKTALNEVLAVHADPICCIITSIDKPYDLHNAAVSLLGPDRVFAPPLLRLTVRPVSSGSTEGNVT